MKTKGQLEYLKIRIFTNIEDDIETKYGLFSQGYDNGYMQCQEDIADKIKEAYEQGLKDGYACMPTINSLNKQD